MRTLTALLAALGLALALAPTAQARTYCCKVTMRYSYGSYDFKTYRIKGKISCKTVRRVLKQSIPLNKEARGWECIKNGAPRGYDVVCGGPKGAEDFSRRVGAILAE
jgi:hypothetical protein